MQSSSRPKTAKTLSATLLLTTLALAGCVTESHRSVTAATVETYRKPYEGPKYALVVGKFQNRSTYMRGIFSDGADQLGNQSKTILKTHLQQTGRFTVMDRANMERIVEEAKLRGETQAIKGAQVVITGDVTEFGRRETGDVQLFGILGYGRKQLAYAKVALNVVDVRTSEIIYSVHGAGEYQLSNREVAGFGSTAGYDATLNGKVLDLAIREAVDHLTSSMEAGHWKP